MTRTLERRAMSRMLAVPERPPRSWLVDRPDDFVMGQTLRVYTSGPNEGRAAGLIQPPPHDSAFLSGRNATRHRNHGRRPPDSRLYPDEMTFFNRGPIEVIEDDGETIGVINGGHLPMFGGHAQQAINAQSLAEAGEWLHREGRWASRADDLGLHGVAYPVDEPGYEGAVLFLGAALPGMTVREAMRVNSTSMSAEVWADPMFGDELVFAGATGVEHTAWPYHRVPEALAAEADDEAVCVGPSCQVFFAASVAAEGDAPAGDVDRLPVEPVPAEDDDLEVVPVTDSNPADAPDVVAPAKPGCGGGCASCSCGRRGDAEVMNDIVGKLDARPTLSPVSDDDAPTTVDNVGAEVTETDINEIVAKLDAFEERFARFETNLTKVTLHVFGPEEVGAANQLAGFDSRMSQIETMLEELAAKADSMGSGSGDAASSGSEVSQAR